MHDSFDAVANYFAAHKRCAHSLVTHADAITNCDRAELKGDTTGVTNTNLGSGSQSLQRNIAWRNFIPR